MKEIIGWILKGLAMGAANVIPGVSGGTIAFITGIYERLINALKSVDLEALKLLIQFRLNGFMEKIDFKFLFFIFLGVGISILSLAKFLEWAFTNHEVITLSFFFGLILASILGVGKQVTAINSGVVITFLIGTAIAVGIAFLPPATSNDGMLYIFLCGIVAVCSMILPGLSGSYILLLMGNYLLVLQAISSFNLGILVPLLVGCVVGLAAFSRLLSYLFSHFRNQTISLLTGFVAGSLVIIWPWKSTIYLDVSSAKKKAIGYDWNLPELNLQFLLAVAVLVVGFGIVFWIDRTGESQTHH